MVTGVPRRTSVPFLDLPGTWSIVLTFTAAQRWDYDIIPTRRYPGMHRVWGNRYGRQGAAAYQPYDEITDLSTLPSLLDA